MNGQSRAQSVSFFDIAWPELRDLPGADGQSVFVTCPDVPSGVALWRIGLRCLQQRTIDAEAHGKRTIRIRFGR